MVGMARIDEVKRVQFGATLEQAKEGSQLVSATKATTWIEFAAA